MVLERLSEADQAQDLLQQHGARVEGIFTHFATADEESDAYFNVQLERFTTILASMKGLPELVHASNSATTLWHAETISMRSVWEMPCMVLTLAEGSWTCL